MKSGYEKNKLKSPTPLSRNELTAIGQASLLYVKKVLDTCKSFDIKVFASIVPKTVKHTQGTLLRKDYSYLFQRFNLYLNEKNEKGIIVFDMIENQQHKRLIGNMRRYFTETYSGQRRSRNIIPEPFFVSSDLTTATQVVDIIAYILNKGLNKRKTEHLIRKKESPSQNIYLYLPETTREELHDFGDKVLALQFECTAPDSKKQQRKHNGIIYMPDLSTRYEKKGLNADDI
ncbi:hypothetical protein ASN18_1469 [Candidatus Magnetominusculus xianensis]|uniref:Uncharacterized protein n=1 Tax=Candidatus Magnetominusculus xianensis TaxID=1748249 RepID=A0ABR5SFM9_9BACT|nr:hypothetical protein ASN18_1469 [Candidatus Magnetominusculus xianensis]